MFNKCLERTVVDGDITDYFNKHALTVDDNILNCIYDFYLSIDDGDLLALLNFQEKLVNIYKRVVGDLADRRSLPFARANNAMRMHSIMVEKCKLSSILYEEDGKALSDLRTLWNDTRLDFYVYNGLAMDIRSVIKIYVKNRILSNETDDVDVEEFISTISERGIRLCEHVNVSILSTLFSDVDKVINGVDKETKDLSVQVNLSIEDEPLPKQRSLRSRK